jgi:hypothetical protein
LSPLQALIADVIGAHPHYQALLRDAQSVGDYEAAADGSADNPFLHMGLHIAVREQLAIDRPPGIRALHTQLASCHGDAHDAEHVLVESLGQTLWEAQRDGRMPDELHYLALARERLAKG